MVGARAGGVAASRGGVAGFRGSGVAGFRGGGVAALRGGGAVGSEVVWWEPHVVVRWLQEVVVVCVPVVDALFGRRAPTV